MFSASHFLRFTNSRSEVLHSKKGTAHVLGLFGGTFTSYFVLKKTSWIKMVSHHILSSWFPAFSEESFVGLSMVFHLGVSGRKKQVPEVRSEAAGKL